MCPLPRRDVEVVRQIVDCVQARDGFSCCCKRYAIVAFSFPAPYISYSPHILSVPVLHVVDNDFVYCTMKNSYRTFLSSPGTILASDLGSKIVRYRFYRVAGEPF